MDASTEVKEPILGPLALPAFIFEWRLFATSLVILALFAVLVIGIFFVIIYATDMGSLPLTVVRVRLLQITLGFLAGLLLQILGAFLVWSGTTGNIDFSFESPLAKFKITTAIPGALLVVCGLAVTVSCVMKNIEIQDGDLHIYTQPMTQQPDPQE